MKVKKINTALPYFHLDISSDSAVLSRQNRTICSFRDVAGEGNAAGVTQHMVAIAVERDTTY